MSQRRQTLANLSPGQLNSRAGGNAGAGRVAKDAPTGLPAKGRKSMAVSLLTVDRPSNVGIDRRSSAFTGKPSGPKQDPRPLNNKEYINSCIRSVITYLSTHNFPAAVSPKTLASPTGKDFAIIIQFLLQQFDPTFRIQGKVEDEVPVFMKRLNYPFQISKSALFAVGSPHSWPAVLAALTWLVELLNYVEKAEESGPTFERENKVAEEFMQYLEANYSAFMTGNDDRCAELDGDMEAKFRAKAGDINERCEKLCQATADLLADIAGLRKAPDPVVAVQQRKEEQVVDMQKFEQLIQNLEGMKVSLGRKLQERQADLRARQEQVNAASAVRDALKARIASQTISKADMNKMLMERSKQQEVLNSETNKAIEMERKLHEQEVQVVRAMTALEGTVERYNKIAHRLKLVPATSKRADGMTYELRLNREATSPADFCNLDLKGVIKPGLERVCDLYRTKASQLSQDLISLREAATALAERNQEKEAENTALKAEVAKLEVQLQAARDMHEERVRRLVVQADGVKAQLEQLRSATTNRLEHIDQRVANMHLEHEQSKRDCEAELVRLESELKTVLHMIYSHKEAMAGMVKRTAEHVHRVRKELAVAPPPAAVLGLASTGQAH